MKRNKRSVAALLLAAGMLLTQVQPVWAAGEGAVKCAGSSFFGGSTKETESAAEPETVKAPETIAAEKETEKAPETESPETLPAAENPGTDVPETLPAAENPGTETVKEPVPGALVTGKEIEAKVAPLAPAADLSNVVNLSDYYLNDAQKNLLAANSFFINTASVECEFFELYESNRYNNLPNFVTVDSMMHTYHLYFAHLLKNTEKTYLSSVLTALSMNLTENSLAQLKALRGTEWEHAARINTAFFAVGASLQGIPMEVPEDVQNLVDAELALIEAQAGIAVSPLFVGACEDELMEDYSQYKPRGYYEGDEDLESYFKAMMWYGRRNFTQKYETLDRCALLMTLAMDEESRPIWDAVYNITSFFAGKSDDNGYYESRPVIDEVFGKEVKAADLVGKADAWKRFHELTKTLNGPAINSTPVWADETIEDQVAENAGFRFMGQRFSLDAATFQELIYSKVKANPEGMNRMLPNALDIPAVLGSDTALSILEAKGETAYDGYMENMIRLRKGLYTEDEGFWKASLYSEWLYTLAPVLDVKGEGYPTFMQSDAWNRKNLQTFLGSYAELKHDTILYSKQVMPEMGGDIIPERDDRGYVEPEPFVFARLADLVAETKTGLAELGLLLPNDEENLKILEELATQLKTIAEKELRAESLTAEEYDLIRSFGGQIEHFWQEALKDQTDKPRTREFPASIVVDIATDPNGAVLEIGTGFVNTIFVLVPIDGQLHLTSGSVYSFYQFTQPISNRLTDTEWRQMIGIQHGEDGMRNRDDSITMEDWILDLCYSWR